MRKTVTARLTGFATWSAKNLNVESDGHSRLLRHYLKDGRFLTGMGIAAIKRQLTASGVWLSLRQAFRLEQSAGCGEAVISVSSISRYQLVDRGESLKVAEINYASEFPEWAISPASWLDAFW
jgi:hypothetical protein